MSAPPRRTTFSAISGTVRAYGVHFRILPPQPKLPSRYECGDHTWQLVILKEDRREAAQLHRSVPRAKPFPRRTFQYAREISRRSGAKAGTEYCKPWT